MGALAKPKSKAERVVVKAHTAERIRQLARALTFLRAEHADGRGAGALDRALASGQYPLVKRSTLYDSWMAKSSKRKGDLRAVLTTDEEALLCEFICLKNQAAQALSRDDIRLVIVKMLQLRSAVNARGGTIYPLSEPAKAVLAGKKPTSYFWSRFFADHPELKEGTASQVSQRRTGACTLGTATKHIAGLVKVLKEVGIMEVGGAADGTILPHNTLRVFNSDETPQFINYSRSQRTMRRVGATGSRLTAHTNEVRESVTLSPLICLDGTIPMLQVLFAQKHITLEQVQPDIFAAFREAGTALVIQSSEKGYQTAKSWLLFLEEFDKWLTARAIVRPVVLLLDGHISRFSLDVLKFCREKQIRVYLSPPDTTGLTQALDQINHVLHYHYCVWTQKWERYVQGQLLELRLLESRCDLGDPALDLVDARLDDGTDSPADSDDDGSEGEDVDLAGRRAADTAPANPRSNSLNKTGFLRVLGGAWPNFNQPASVIGAFDRVGITAKEVSVDLMQKDKFKAADMLLNRANASAAATAAAAAEVEATAGPARELQPGQVFRPMALRSLFATPGAADSSSGPPEHVPTPSLARAGTSAYWQHRYEQERLVSASLREQLSWFSSTPRLPTLDNEELFPFDKVASRVAGGRTRVGVGIFGCLEEAGALEAIAAAKADEESKEEAKKQRLAQREEKKSTAQASKAAAAEKKTERMAAYFACLAAREAGQAPCACGAANATGCVWKKHQLCTTCNSVTLGGCSKKGGACEQARMAARTPSADA